MNIIIIGCGRVGAKLAQLLSEEDHNVTIIDKNPSAFHRISDYFNGIKIVGNGFDLETLKKADIKNSDVFVVVTNGDNTNIMASQVAKKIFNVPKVITRLYDPRRAEIYQKFGLDIISGTKLVASMIRDRIIESSFSSYFIETKGLGILEIKITKELSGKKISDLNINNEFLVATLVRNSETILPSPDFIINRDDLIVGIAKVASIDKIKKMFNIDVQKTGD